MALVSAFFDVFHLPSYVLYLLVNVNPNLAYTDVAYFATLFSTFLYICTNPFVYAIKFDPVRQILLRLIGLPCRRIFEQVSENFELAELPLLHREMFGAGGQVTDANTNSNLPNEKERYV